MRIAVVGAGLAGLSCAQRLAGAGLQIACLDKSRGPSGRMATRRRDGLQFDHGAQYFTARDPAFAETVRDWVDAGVAAPWLPRLAVFDAPGSLARRDAREPGHEADANSNGGAGGGVARFVGTPTMTAPAQRLASALAVTYGCTVRALRRGANGWRLSVLEDGHASAQQDFDAVVVAVPAPQAAALLEASDPAPQALAALAQSARMRGCWAAMVHCAEPLPLDFDAAFVNAGPLRWVARDSSKPGRCGPDAWVLHASAAWSQANLEREPAQVASELLAAFAALGAPVLRSGLPAPGVAAVAHRWRYADTEPALDRRYAWDEAQRIGLCGDWLHGGRIEGAWLSGRALAGAVLAG
jgi:renalase